MLSDLLNLTVKVTTPPCYFDHVTVSLLQAIIKYHQARTRYTQLCLHTLLGVYFARFYICLKCLAAEIQVTRDNVYLTIPHFLPAG